MEERLSTPRQPEKNAKGRGKREGRRRSYDILEQAFQFRPKHRAALQGMGRTRSVADGIPTETVGTSARNAGGVAS